MNNKKVKFGIIGIGNMGTSHANGLDSIKNCQLTAVCDIDENAFLRIDEKIRPQIKCFTNVDEFFALADMDAVIIAVPHYDHVDLAIKAMQANKHIIVEKPISVHKNEAQRLINEAKKYPNLIKSAMFNQRTKGAHQKIKQLIDSGMLGQIRRINWIITDWFRTQYYYDSGDWRASWRGEGGGVLLNQCPHQLDLMQWLFGMPNKVQAIVKLGKYHNIEVEDEVNAYLEYADGKIANFIASTGEIPGTNRLEITAENGRLIFEDNKISFKRNEMSRTYQCDELKEKFTSATTWDCVINFRESPLQEHQAIISNLANAILNGEKLIAPMEEGINGLELGNAMLFSGLNEKVVNMPLNGDDFENMLNNLIKNSRYKKNVAQATYSSDANFNQSF